MNRKSLRMALSIFNTNIFGPDNMNFDLQMGKLLVTRKSQGILSLQREVTSTKPFQKIRILLELEA